MSRLAKPIYESLPAAYLLGGVAMLVLSYRNSASWWSGLCSVLGLAALVAGLAVWLHRRDYRATSADYLRRGKPVLDNDEPRS